MEVSDYLLSLSGLVLPSFTDEERIEITKIENDSERKFVDAHLARVGIGTTYFIITRVIKISQLTLPYLLMRNEKNIILFQPRRRHPLISMRLLFIYL